MIIQYRAVCKKKQTLTKNNCIWSYFFYYDKSWNVKKYPFANVIFFSHLVWKTFCHLDTILQCLSLGKKVFHIKWQKLFTFANGNFCHFNVCHSRRNSFWFRTFLLSNRFVQTIFYTSLKQMDIRSFLCFLDQKRSQEHSVSILVLTFYC